MADQKKNDVAEALAALAGGAVPSETESPSGGIPSESTVFSPPAAEQPVAPAPAFPPSRPGQKSDSRPAAPRAPQSAAPSNQLPPSPAAISSTSSADGRTVPFRPTGSPNLLPQDLPLPSAIPPPARIRPANPDGSPGRARPAMPERPVAAPAPPAPLVNIEEVPETIPEIIEDEETIAAAPDASAFAPRVVRKKPAHTPVYASLFFRRTIIPILLTCGVMLLCIGLWSMLDKNAPLAAIGTGVEVMLIAIGAVLLGLGIINALHVKNALETSAKRQNG